MPAARVSPAVTEQKSTVLSKNTSSEDPESGSLSSQSLEKGETLSPYESVLYRLNHDEKWYKEISLGRRVGFYRFRGELGTGNFSQVKAAVHCLTRERVAVKILDKAKLDQKTQKMLSREIVSMESLHHPHIIRLYEVMENLSKIYLVMEYASGGELFHKISNDGRFPEEEAKPLFAQVTSALDHMHSHNIIHRDIKAENVFFSGPNIVKVGDFGFSTQVSSRDDALQTFCGSPPYAAPELFYEDSYVGPLVDIWALGVLLFFMLTANMPFKAPTVSGLKKLIIDGQFSIPTYLSPECHWLLKGILQQNPSSRLTLVQVKRCRWMMGQTLPAELPKYSMQPPGKEEIPKLSPEEVFARRRLKDLGITEEMMKDCWEKGAKSSVTGTYRIVLHKIQNSPILPERLTLDSSGNGKASKKTETCVQAQMKKMLCKNKKSRACAII